VKLLKKEIAPPDEQKGQYIFVSSPLISQNIRLSELAPFQLLSNDDDSLAGCRGIAGPFPPPLWIRAPCGAIELFGHNIMGDRESQLYMPNIHEFLKNREVLIANDL
jgi:hypothetical protein